MAISTDVSRITMFITIASEGIDDAIGDYSKVGYDKSLDAIRAVDKIVTDISAMTFTSDERGILRASLQSLLQSLNKLSNYYVALRHDDLTITPTEQVVEAQTNLDTQPVEEVQQEVVQQQEYQGRQRVRFNPNAYRG